jgi:hypothetical protein
MTEDPKPTRDAETEMTPSTLDPLDLYELCVQNPTALCALLRAIHGNNPRKLGEDFSGTAALSRAWVGTVDGGTAVAVDHDPVPIERARGVENLHAILGDVRTASEPGTADVDLIWVGNFSIGELHNREQLLIYLRHARHRLNAGGAFVCDTYGGESAFLTGEVHRYHPVPNEIAQQLGLPAGARVRYTWHQREADPLTGIVENALHFRVEIGGHVEHEVTDAFVYHWRLWSVPELRDAMLESGFSAVECYAQLPDAIDEEGNAYVKPIENADEELDDSFIVCVAGRA